MVTLALIGVGKWGKNFLTSDRLVAGCRIKYVCSRTKQTLVSLPKKYIKTNQYTDLYRYGDIDGVIIATPTASHYTIARDFLKRGYNLLIEKPLTTRYGQALKLERIQKQTRAKILIGHTYLYHPAYLKAKQLLKKIGPVRYVGFEGLNSGHFAKDLSVLWEWGSHSVALATDILGRLPQQLAAWKVSLIPTKHHATAIWLRLDFTHKASALLKFGWLFPTKKRQLIIIGVKGTLVFDDMAEKKLAFFRYQSLNAAKKQALNMAKPRVSYPHYSQEMPLEAELKAFVNLISTGNPPATDLHQAVKITRILSLAEKSLNSEGETISLRT